MQDQGQKMIEKLKINNLFNLFDIYKKLIYILEKKEK